MSDCELRIDSSLRSAEPNSQSEIRNSSWCPRKDSNLQPLVCRTSALSIELLGQEMVVGVGIEPTFRAFQTRANPSQLSDRKEGDEFLTPSAFARCAPFNDRTIIVHVHEQVLAPLGSCLGVVTKHHAFEL